MYIRTQRALAVGASVIFNIFIHGLVDHLKANKKRINLIADQCIHMIQILDTFAILIIGNFGS